jgi:hypothetical protein
MQRFRKKLVALILILAVPKGFAALSELVISDATVSAQDISNPQDIKIFGGFNGACPPGTNLTTSTCNTCANVTNLIAPVTCNTRAIHSDLRLAISFKVDSVPASSSFLARINSNNVTFATVEPSAGPVANQTLTVTIDWDELCIKGQTSGTACSTTTSLTNTLEVGVSNGSSTTEFSNKVNIKVTVVGRPSAGTFASNLEVDSACGTDEGFCRYQIFPGDGKVFIENLSRAATGPGGSANAKWAALRIYYSPTTANPMLAGNFDDLSPASAPFKDFAIKDKSSVTSEVVGNTIEGLANGTEYFFVAATVDEAGNIQYFANPAKLAANPHLYVATPQKVIGLLQGEQCFIATAAFGSKQAWQVELLREFRDQVLLKSAVGKTFVEFYYRHSPPVANAIEKRPWAKSIVRAALWPVTLTASLILDVVEMMSGEANEN